MTDTANIWLVANPASGSNDEEALKALKSQCEERGLCLTRRIAFPREDLPTPAELDEAGIGIVAVFAGDGTINALITALEGWRGAVLVLPGGTMNLLSIRLHGEKTSSQIVDDVSRGATRRVRPAIVRCEAGTALAGLLVGPATAWGDVREAMRDIDIPGFVGETIAAVEKSTAGEMVRCVEPPAGSPDGYPLLMFTPEGLNEVGGADGHFSLKAYHADNVGDFMKQGLAIMRRNFREGPHDDLGNFEAMTLESAEGGALALLIDGEAAEISATARFETATCGVDLIATARG